MSNHAPSFSLQTSRVHFCLLIPFHNGSALPPPGLLKPHLRPPRFAAAAVWGPGGGRSIQRSIRRHVPCFPSYLAATPHAVPAFILAVFSKRKEKSFGNINSHHCHARVGHRISYTLPITRLKKSHRNRVLMVISIHA
ncbi:hypothetical protein LZ32DRAFT_321502 [Colletotrichum eremochloae]|nr:hypothetical protein LZ32DRAFT_321502 [Colletotrichum eremochloae]